MNTSRRQLIGGISLFAAAGLALAIANSPIQSGYHWLASQDWLKGIAIFLFFLSVGSELRHEIVSGSLRRPKQSVVPIFAAMGGMAVPILIFSAITVGTQYSVAWGIPMSTDIAFALGAIAIAGRWLPKQVRVFVMTVAVVDDSLTILMIAIFYASSFHVLSLVSLAGVVLGLLLPLGKKFLRALEPLVAFVALPLFAFLSAGVSFGEISGFSLISLGIIVAMVIGKPLGVLGTTWLVTKFGLGKLAPEVTWPLLRRVGLVFGMCFTVSMLMSELSLGDNLALHSVANISVLVATSFMAVAAMFALTFRKPALD